MHWLLAGMWLCLALLCPAAQAQTLTANGEVPVERALWVDPTGQATLETVLSQSFQPAPTIVARGYQAGATWLRVTVPPTAAESLWITVQPLYLDDVQVHTRPWQADGTPGPWTLRQEGDRFAFTTKERPTLLYSLALQASPDHPTVFYVRLRTTSTHAMYVKVRTSLSALDVEGKMLLLVGLLVGSVLVLTLTSAARFVVTRDPLWATNSLFQLNTLAVTLSTTGLLAKYLLPDLPQGVDAISSTLLCAHLFFGVLYYWRFAASFHIPRAWLWLYASALLAFPWQLWLIWSGNARPAMALNSNLLLLATLLGMGMVWLFKIEDTRLRRLVRFTYLTQTVYLLVFILPILGVGQMTLVHLYPALLSNLFGSVMQYMVLSRRDQLTLQAQQKLEHEMETTQVELRAQQGQLAESHRFLGMLLHELKNPLASVRLATLNLLRPVNQLSADNVLRVQHIQAATLGMDAVLDRCRQVDRLETGAWTSRTAPTDAAARVAYAVAQHAEASRIRLSSPSTLLATLDGDCFDTMVGNLLDNALAYSPPGSAVQVQLVEQPGTQQRPRYLVLTVRNAVGKAGLPESGRVFGKYYRAEGAHQRTGSGLGLYLVKNLAQHAGGDITHRAGATADGKPEAIFEIQLPCH